MDESGLEKTPEISQPEILPASGQKAPEQIVKSPIGQLEQGIIIQIQQGDKRSPDIILKNIAGSGATSGIAPSTEFTPSQPASAETKAAVDGVKAPESPFSPKTGSPEFNRPQSPDTLSPKKAWEGASARVRAPSRTPEQQTINMVKGPDGIWTIRPHDDPDFYYHEKPVQDSAVENTVPIDSSQEIIEKWRKNEPIGLSDLLRLAEQQRQNTPQSPDQPPPLSARERWERNPFKPETRTIIDVKPVEIPTQRTPKSGETQEQFVQRTEVERQNFLQQQRAEGSRLATLIYTPEGQQQVSSVKSLLDTIVEASVQKPRHVPGFGRERGVIEIQEELIDYNQRIEDWKRRKGLRADELLNGERMNNLEETVFLSSVLGPDHKSTLDQKEERLKNDALIEEFNKLNAEIGKALDYQKSETLPIEERPQFADEAKLIDSETSFNQSREAFASGWNEIRSQSTNEMKTDEESAKVEDGRRKPGQKLATPMR